MKKFIFRFTAHTPRGNYESCIPADDYVEAYEALTHNAIKTTGVPVQCWVATHVTDAQQ